jgi:hypothetical protein
VDLRAHKLPKPFCTIEQAAYFLDLSLNQVNGGWGRRNLPVVRTVAGDTWMPGDSKLIDCPQLFEMLDEQGREFFWLWQRDELVLKPMAVSHGRHLPVRRLHAEAAS